MLRRCDPRSQWPLPAPRRGPGALLIDHRQVAGASGQLDRPSIKLARLGISGGISDAHLDLPPPGAVVPIRISGGVSDLALRRPADTGVALAVSGGISGLRLDDQGFDAIGGGARLATGPVHGDAPRYAIDISGGASSLHVVPRRASADVDRRP